MGNQFLSFRCFYLPTLFLIASLQISCGTAQINVPKEEGKVQSLLTETSDSNSNPERAPASFGRLPFRLNWPLNTTRMSRGFFNGGSSRYHDGIDLPARSGTKITAAASGRVVYSGRAFHGYGKMILIEHTRGLATLYAHCQSLLVKTGDRVDQGQKIALVGKTGRASAPHLHFEVRINKKPVDPLEFLN